MVVAYCNMLYYKYYFGEGSWEMKIGIVGNYGNNNNGDEAILLGLIKQVTSTLHIDTNQITVFSNNPEQTSKRYGVESYPLYYRTGNPATTFLKTYKMNKKIVQTFDMLIIGGGGILMDLYKREAPLYGSYAMMAQRSNVPYAIYACGAGPLHTKLGKWFIRQMSMKANYVSVRDPESAALLYSLGIEKNIRVFGDPAFYLRRENTPQKSDKPKKIGVTAVPYYNKDYWPEGNEELYQNYIEGMARNLDALAEENEDVEITFFATKFPQDANVTKDIQRLMQHRDKTMIIDENLLPEDILDVVEKQDVVIGTRLHSLILSLCTSTPIIAISYHHKVKDFMDHVGLSAFNVPMEQLHENNEFFAEAFGEMKLNWQSTVLETEELSKKLYSESEKATLQLTGEIAES